MALKKASELYLEIVGRSSVYNIAPIDNVLSIMKRGILCFDRAEDYRHQSIAMNSVQERRASKRVPNGRKLHEYANMYFDPRNPMMYRRQEAFEDICVLAVSVCVLDIDGTVVSDGNAASNVTRFYEPIAGMQELDFDKIFAQWWTNDDPWEQENCKRIKCAEVLVPNRVSYDDVTGAIVVNEVAHEKLLDAGFDKRIAVRPGVFFR